MPQARLPGLTGRIPVATARLDSRQVTTAPRAAAIAGVIFSVLLILGLVLIRLSVPADPSLPGTWVTDPDRRTAVRLALNLFPFAGIAFLWFMGVLRNRLGAKEDQFLATAFLGSGLLFVVSLFTAAAIAAGLLEALAEGRVVLPDSEAYYFGRRTVYMLLNVFAFKMAAVFMFSTGTIGLRTAFLPRWVAMVGYVCGLVLLLVITSWAWIGLLFPFWVLLVSTVVLTTEFRRRSQDPAGQLPARPAGQDGGACDRSIEQHENTRRAMSFMTHAANRHRAGEAADSPGGSADQPANDLRG
jgi:hypothetical protein